MDLIAQTQLPFGPAERDRVDEARLRAMRTPLRKEGLSEIPHNKKRPLAESGEGDAAQKTCAYGPAENTSAPRACRFSTGASRSTETKREARRTLTSEFGLCGKTPEASGTPGKNRKVTMRTESIEAYQSVRESAATVRAKVLDWFRQQGERGATVDELVRAWGCSPNHVAPRVSEMRRSGVLVPLRSTWNGAVVRRKTQAGHSAVVLVAR